MQRHPVDVGGVDPLIVAVEYAVTTARKEAGVPLYFWQQLITGDAVRDRPGRVDDDVFHLCFEQRRFGLGLPDDHLCCHQGLAVSHQRGLESRNVDEQEIRPTGVEDTPRSHHVEAQLGDAPLDGNVQRLQGLAADQGIGLEPVARLETAHGGLQLVVVDSQNPCPGVEVARYNESSCQRRHARLIAAGRDRRAGGKRRPATVFGNLQVLFERVLQALVGGVVRFAAGSRDCEEEEKRNNTHPAPSKRCTRFP